MPDHYHALADDHAGFDWSVLEGSYADRVRDAIKGQDAVDETTRLATEMASNMTVALVGKLLDVLCNSREEQKRIWALRYCIGLDDGRTIAGIAQETGCKKQYIFTLVRDLQRKLGLRPSMRQHRHTKNGKASKRVFQ